MLLQSTPSVAQVENPRPSAQPEANAQIGLSQETGSKIAVDDAGEFLRIQRDASGRPLSMSTSIKHFEGKPQKLGGRPIKVDLVSAVHIGELEYYQELNRRFENYDAVLYELIAPEDPTLEDRRTMQQRSDSSNNPVSILQRGMKQMLGLEFQLEKVDYAKKNFIHADLSPEGFANALQSRGESIWNLAARLIMQSIIEEQEKQNPYASMLLIMAIATSPDSDRKYVFRRYLAENFRQLDSLVEKIEGDKGSPLVRDRNAKALEVLSREMKKGKTRFAIFYGAAHMPNFEESLTSDFGMTSKGLEWVPAWRLQPPTQSSDNLSLVGPASVGPAWAGPSSREGASDLKGVVSGK